VRCGSALTLALGVVLAWAAPAAAACPPPDLVLSLVRSATRVQMEQLGGDGTRADTVRAHVPGRTLGYEVHGLFVLSPDVAAAMREAFGRRDSWACAEDAPGAAFETPEGLRVGLLFSGPSGAVAAVVRLPEGELEMQRVGGARTRVPLSRTGQRRWERALDLLARQTHADRDEFYRQMLPPDQLDGPAPPPAPADAGEDTTGARRDASRTPR